MAQEFDLEVLTPERQFISCKAEAVTVTATDGELTVLANHAPMVTTIAVGVLKGKIGGEWKEAFNSEGYMVVRRDRVIIFTLACEYPEEIDLHRAEEAKHKAEEELRQKQSIVENKETKLALARAMARLKVGRNSGKYI